MKKIIAIAMAVAMMMAIAVPAFAAANPVTQDTTDQFGEAVVKTTYDETQYTYTVTIPADLTITWNDSGEKNMTYYVESQLLIGYTLTVSVAGSGKLTASSGDTLSYTLTGGDDAVFQAVNAANTTSDGVVNGTNVKVQIPSFAGVPVGEYSDTLTFTVDYKKATA